MPKRFHDTLLVCVFHLGKDVSGGHIRHERLSPRLTNLQNRHWRRLGQAWPGRILACNLTVVASNNSDGDTAIFSDTPSWHVRRVGRDH